MKTLNKKAFSIVEYTVLFVIVVGAFLIMRNYIQRGIYGLWGQAGQSFAYGRQYDPQKSVECAFDPQTSVWYDHNCFVSLGCSMGDAGCEGSCEASSCNQVDNSS